MNFRTIGIWMIFSVVFMVAGCASTKPKPFSDATGSVKTVGIISPKNPEVYWYFDGGSPGKLLGAVGVLLESGTQSERAEKFDSMLKNAHFDFSDEFTLALTERLEAVGYKVVFVRSDRPSANSFVKNYQSLGKEKVDAYLDFSIAQIGYMSPSVTDSAFRPDIVLDVQLVNPSGESLYAQKFEYGTTNPFISGIEIAAASSDSFSNYDALMKNPQKVISALNAGASTLAQRISSDLKGGDSAPR